MWFRVCFWFCSVDPCVLSVLPIVSPDGLSFKYQSFCCSKYDKTRLKSLLFWNQNTSALGPVIVECSGEYFVIIVYCGATPHSILTLNVPIATKVVCFSRLLKCLCSLCGKQCGPRSDCSYRSSLFWVHNVSFYT